MANNTDLFHNIAILYVLTMEVFLSTNDNVTGLFKIEDKFDERAFTYSIVSTSLFSHRRIALKLLRHGASITMGNRLGLTPVHIAAGQGHLQALQVRMI